MIEYMYKKIREHIPCVKKAWKDFDALRSHFWQIQIRIRNLCYHASTFAVIFARCRKSRLKFFAKMEKS